MINIIDNNIFSKNQRKEGLLNIEFLKKLFSFSYLIENEIENTNIPYINIMKNFLISCKKNLEPKSLREIVNKLCSKIFEKGNIYIIYYLMNIIFELNLSRQINDDETILIILSSIINYGNKNIEFNKKTTLLLLQIYFDLYIFTKEEIRKILSEVDKQGEGNISYEDFLSIMTQKMLERDPIEEMKKAFHLICEEGQDKITLKSLQKVAKELGENMTIEELQEMIEEADRDGDGEIGEEDFLKVMKKTNLF